jgi:hypothetical protein
MLALVRQHTNENMLGCLKQGALKEEEKYKKRVLIFTLQLLGRFFKKMQNAPPALGTLFFFN